MALYGAVEDARKIRQPSAPGRLGLDFVIVTLDGSNPTSFQFTEFVQVLAAEITLISSSAPGLDPADFTYVINGSNKNQVDVYAWKYTSNANPTLIASTNNTAQIAIMVVGIRREGQSI